MPQKLIPNRYRIEGDTAILTLTRGYETIIDLTDLPQVSQFRWCACGTNGYIYAVRSFRKQGGGCTLLGMHRYILGYDLQNCVDHIDGDTLNNRRANLRSCTHAENMLNRRANRGSINKGIIRRPDGLWSVGIRVRVDNFTSPEEAAKAYDDLAAILHGEFAKFNFPVRQKGSPRFRRRLFASAHGPEIPRA